MLSWRGRDGSAGNGRFLIDLLLNDARIVRGASSKAALNQQSVQFDKCRHRHTRCADLHASASDRIQHPGRYHAHHAGRRLDVNKLPGGALLAVSPPYTATVKRMPLVMDLELLADMGRMIGTFMRCAMRRTISTRYPT